MIIQLNGIARGLQVWLAFVIVSAISQSVLADDAELYKPKGQEAWDFWFARSNDTYYAFYLQGPEGLGAGKFERSTVGLATSKDLFQWNEVGEVLHANAKGQWCDGHIATGSVWSMGGKWHMLFTACGNSPGIGSAESDDLKTWKMVGPVTFDYKSHVMSQDATWKGRGRDLGLEEDESFRYAVLADPYVLPEPIDGWQYMIANCAIVGRPLNSRGCIGLMRTKDGKTWEDCGVVAVMPDYDRPETPQMWRHGDRWYLYFGGAREEGAFCRHNRIYTAGSFKGPFLPASQSELKLPDGRSFYIAKVVVDPDGKDVLLSCVDGARLSRPYPIQYASDGSVLLGAPVDSR